MNYMIFSAIMILLIITLMGFGLHYWAIGLFVVNFIFFFGIAFYNYFKEK